MAKREYRIGLGIGEDRHGNPLGRDVVNGKVAYIEHEAARLFGGYSITESRGGWINDDGRLVREPGLTISIVAGPEYEHSVRAFAAASARSLGQAAFVFIRPGGEADIIDVKYPRAHSPSRGVEQGEAAAESA